ncbi:hypothetical protein Q3W71_06895 [Micromonospora sp. C28SCA-DRY-2]|uniref:hypothetical protein n=1 Tax=Micromonospora sp. C28SCA-DRY-2 TaxID=3059522 RepID=UPI0026749158|nr:hypothetical protein [Micromonospora sp. C28SCA-DRY-2]MDO3701407.1 hypothetical protein [Micromonospora sp. C28SCA-DRY-2]
MARADVSPARRARSRRLVPLLAVPLALGLALTVLPGWATAAAPAALVTAPGTAPADEPDDQTPTADPTDPVPTTAPPTSPETTPPATPTADPEPTATDTGAPTTGPPATAGPATPVPVPPPVRPSAPGPGTPPGSPLGVRVSTGDIQLSGRYWNAASTVATLRVSITNTGTARARIRLGYTLPAGLSDAGTAGCVATGGGEHRCGEWTTAPGARFSTRLKVRVSGTAWRNMPLSGSVRVTATAPGTAGPVTDNEGFAVLFPPGPPVPGITLQADEVAFDISGGAAELAVRLGNTGRVDASGRIEVVLPDGVSVPTPPAGCAAAAGRTRCEVGTVPAGRSAELRLPVVATPEAQRAAPLSGAVVGHLDPRQGRTRQVQMSFRITAAAALTTQVAAAPGPTGSQGVVAATAPVLDRASAGLSSVQRTAILLIAVSALLVVLALTLATVSLRRRMTTPVAEPAATPATPE